MDSVRHLGPLVNCRTEKLWMMHDPLKIGKIQRIDFEIELYDAISSESVVVVCSKSGNELTRSNVYNDYGGNSTSMYHAIEDATNYAGQQLLH